MNSEQIKNLAGDAMDVFLHEHNSGCFLCIENLAVHAYPKKDAPPLCPRCLIITKWELENGLLDCQWNSIASELLNLYNEDVACHTHQKP